MINENIPKLNTALAEPVLFFEKRLLADCKNIEAWFQKQWQKYLPPVYGSVDLRNSGFKLAPIDMNLFPAGFNNLNPDFLPHAIEAAKSVITRLSPKAKRILIIPESHTRNLYYWQNVKTLQKILEGAGFMVRIGFLSPELTEKRNLSFTFG